MPIVFEASNFQPIPVPFYFIVTPNQNYQNCNIPCLLRHGMALQNIPYGTKIRIVIECLMRCPRHHFLEMFN